MRTLFLAIILIPFALQGFSQYKYEKETRIKEADVPKNALSFVESLNFNTKIKWYEETGYDRISFEAKTKYNGKLYSIEFSEEGTFEDVEIVIEPDEIPSSVFTLINNYLHSKYNKLSIQKIQIQYKGDRDEMIHFLNTEESNEHIETNYELVISAKIEGSFVLFEYLFSGNGEFINRQQIILKRFENIQY